MNPTLTASGLNKEGQTDDGSPMHISGHTLRRVLGEWMIGAGPAHRKLSDRLRLLILDGRLPLGTTMPGERDAAATLGVSRTTISTAYTTLRTAGYLETQERTRSITAIPGDTSSSHHGTELVDARLIDFAHASPAAPEGQLHSAYTAALEQLPRHPPHHGYARIGLPELRAAVANRYCARGLPTFPE